MSWRRFCVLYGGLGPGSLVCLNYDRVARREGVRSPAREDSAWGAFIGLSKPDTRR